MLEFTNNEERELLEDLSYLLFVREKNKTQDEKDNTTTAFFDALIRLGVEPNLARKIAIYVIRPFE